jgi:dTDP-glucose 4,6-dehydratase
MTNDWKDKRVLITGADGFIGSHLTESLIAKGAKVSIYAQESSNVDSIQCKLNNISHLRDKFVDVITGDISTRDSMTFIKKNEPEVLFHLAAKAYVNYSFDHPYEVMQTNVMGTLNVLEAARLNDSIKRVVCTSSSEIYGTAQKIPIDEAHPLNPSTPYAASKVAADRYCYAYWNTYGIPVAIIRPFNTFGPRHTYDVIPKFINLALNNKTLTVYGGGKQERDFLYVEDTVRAFEIMGLHKNAVGKFVNFATGKSYSINYTAEKIIEIAKSKSKIVHVDKRLGEVDILCGDYSFAKKLFGWEPKVSFEEGLKKNIEFVRNT